MLAFGLSLIDTAMRLNISYPTGSLPPFVANMKQPRACQAQLPLDIASPQVLLRRIAFERGIWMDMSECGVVFAFQPLAMLGYEG
jgi:hypothetical protein